MNEITELIKSIPNKVLNLMPEKHKDSAYCYVFVGNADTDFLTFAAIENHGDFYHLCNKVCEIPLKESEMIASVKANEIIQDEIRKKDALQLIAMQLSWAIKQNAK